MNGKYDFKALKEQYPQGTQVRVVRKCRDNTCNCVDMEGYIDWKLYGDKQYVVAFTSGKYKGQKCSGVKIEDMEIIDEKIGELF